MSGLVEAWQALDAAWQASFLLAWEALQAGSVPVGAVVTDPTGQIVSSGRNRRCELGAPSGQISGTALAHAELNALAQLPPGGYPDHVLTTTLEPCLLCTSALTHSHVGTVRYAASDALCAGLRDLPELNEHVKRRWPAWRGPMLGPLADFSNLLVTIWHMDHRPEHVWLQGSTRLGPNELAEARAAATTLRERSLPDALPGFVGYVSS